MPGPGPVTPGPGPRTGLGSGPGLDPGRAPRRTKGWVPGRGPRRVGRRVGGSGGCGRPGDAFPPLGYAPRPGDPAPAGEVPAWARTSPGDCGSGPGQDPGTGGCGSGGGGWWRGARGVRRPLRVRVGAATGTGAAGPGGADIAGAGRRRADGGGAARAGGPDGGAADRGEPVDAAGRGRHRGRAVLAPRRGRLAGRGQGGGPRPGAGRADRGRGRPGRRGARGDAGPRVLGQPEGAARRLLDQAGLGAEVLAGCDTDPARAAAGPGRVWRSGPAPGAQAPLGSRVRLWVNPPGCPPSATTTTSAGEG